MPSKSRKAQPKKADTATPDAKELPHVLLASPIAGKSELLPDWVESPYQQSCSLCIFDGGGDAEQEIDITYQEFLEIKRYLLKLRGFHVLDITEPQKEEVQYFLAMRQPGGELEPCVYMDRAKFELLKHLIDCP